MLMLSFRARTTIEAMRNPLLRSRLRWFSVAILITLATTMIGGGFLIAGDRLPLADGPWVIYSHIPGGLHTHGAVMFALGIALVAGLSNPMFGNPEPRPFMTRVLRWTAWYYTWAWGLIWLAPLEPGGTFSYLGVILWGVLTAQPWVLLTSPPPVKLSRNETDLVEAALQVGVTPEQASRLAQVYLRDGNAHG